MDNADEVQHSLTPPLLSYTTVRVFEACNILVALDTFKIMVKQDGG